MKEVSIRHTCLVMMKLLLAGAFEVFLVVGPVDDVVTFPISEVMLIGCMSSLGKSWKIIKFFVRDCRELFLGAIDLNDLIHVRCKLIDTWGNFFGLTFLGNIWFTDVSHLCLDCNIILLSWFCLLHALSLGEWLFASFLRWYNFWVIKVNLVNAIVDLSPIELAEDVLAELIEGHKIATLMLSDQLIQVGINLYVMLA